MKINQNRPETKQVPVNVINTMLEQISNLQTDVATLQNEVDGFDQSVDTVNIEATQAAIDAINATNISSTNATINNITASGNVDIANLDANTADIDTATIGTETVGTSTITDATIATAKITDLDTVTGAVQHLSADNIEADSVDADTITTEGITNSGNYTGMDATLIGDLTVNGAAETGGLHVHGDLNVDGQVLTAQEIIGARKLNVANFHADDSSLVRAEIDKLGVNEEYLREVNALVPSPSLVSDSDRYTIELPRFTGVMKLVWMESEYEWTATVIGNGRDYCVTWSSYDPNEMYITQLFQWAGHLYIRHRANGKLYYSYSAEREITQSINIYYNMGAWPYPEDLETLCDERHKIDVTRPDGTVWFGAVNIPMLEKNEGCLLVFKGSTTFSGLPQFSDVMPGDVWNITDEAYTDNRFVEGAGKPINAGDDIIAVEVKVEDTEETVLMWDKFAAGVNYDNFTAQNITANGDLTVAGDTTLANTTVTGSLKKNNSEVLTEADKTNVITENSTDVITSGAVYAGLATKVDKTTTVNGHPLSSNVTVTKADVGLGNVDNTSDLNKPISTVTQTALDTKINLTEKGASNGVATLDATGRVPYNQLPESAMEYKGTWDASTNTPTLADGTGTNGDFYVVSTAGTVTFSAGRSITFYVNDRVIYDGNLNEWERLPAGEVRSVNGQTGDVTLAIPTVVDTVADGNMNAVTSNAVYDYIDAAITQVLNTGF